MRRILAAAAALTLAGILGAACAPTRGRAAAYAPAGNGIVANINAHRGFWGRAPLQTHGELTAVAQAWAEQLAARNSLSHQDLGSRLGAPWIAIGENVGRGANAAEINQAFANSPSHFNNIINPSYQYVGVGVAYAGDGTMYVVQDFMQLG